MPDVDGSSEWFFDDHPSKSIVKMFIDVSWWLDGMHEADGLILEDACAVIDPMVHMGDEETGEIIDGRHQSPYRVMEELVVREFFVHSILIQIGKGDVIDREIWEAKSCPCHPERSEDMVIAVLMEGLS